MPDIPLSRPKAFISYSWSSPEHEARVLDLATELREAGVDAVLDKWDLREGEEANAFMERMVTDPEIAKVVICSDRAYAEKSDTRTGGAGTEAQIISPRLYANADAGKFVLLVFEKNDAGHAYLPAYYTSRIFIDFTDPARATDSFEQLIRWVFDKPLHKKPDIGRPPAYLDAGAATVTLATSAAHRRAMDAVQNSRPHAFAATQDYLEALTEQLPAFRIGIDTDPLSDDIEENYRSFIPYRNEVIVLARALARAAPDPRYGDALHAFLERFLAHFHPTPDRGRYREFDFDNYKFFAHELFLYLCTTALVEGRIDLFETLAARPYYDHVRDAREGMAIGTYEIFRHYDNLLDHRNKALKLNRYSLQVDLLQERTAGTGFRWEQLMQTDFMLFLRSALFHAEPYYSWYPTTLQALRFGHRAFEMFARAQSKRELAMVLQILGLPSRAPLDTLIREYTDKTRKAPSYDGGWEHLNVAKLVGHAELGTRP